MRRASVARDGVKNKTKRKVMSQIDVRDGADDEQSPISKGDAPKSASKIPKPPSAQEIDQDRVMEELRTRVDPESERLAPPGEPGENAIRAGRDTIFRMLCAPAIALL